MESIGKRNEHGTPFETIKILSREDRDRIRSWFSTWLGEGQAEGTAYPEPDPLEKITGGRDS